MLFGMGNKDSRRREAKKPKKKTPKLAPPKRDVNQLAAQIVKNATAEKS
jgi:hypothetical protein